MDGPKLTNSVFVDPRNVKRIAVNCRCGQRFVTEVPGEVLAAQLRTFSECPACKQGYILFKDKIVRLDADGRPEKVIELNKSTVTPANQGHMLDEIEKFLKEQEARGVVVNRAESRKIN